MTGEQLQLQQLQKQKLRLRSSVEAEASQIRQKVLDPLRVEVEELTTKAVELKASQDSKISELEMVTLEVNKAKNELDLTQNAHDKLIAEHTQLETDHEKIIQAYSASRQSANELKVHIDSLMSEKTALLRSIKELTDTFETKKAENDNKLTEIETKIQSKASEYLQKDREYEFIRKDLASRAKVADERDKVLGRREMIVNQSEQTIQQNANLLNL